MRESATKRQPALIMLRLFVSMGLMISVVSGCGLTGDPIKLFNNTITALSGMDHFTFTGTTQYAMNGLPSSQGVAFEGMVTGQNHLKMQVVSEQKNKAAVNAATESGKNASSLKQGASEGLVVFNRSEDKWIVREDHAPNGFADQLIRFNPMVHLERLNGMSKQIQSARDPITLHTLLSVVPDQEEITKIIKNDLNEQMKKLDPVKKLQELQEQLKLTNQEASAMRREVEQSLADALKKLEEMSSSLRAESTYLIGIDRKTNNIQTMRVDTTTRYNVEGQGKEEVTHVSYTFVE